jgi:hypothetical protein
MSAREELIVKYAADLKKCGVNPDMDLLTKVTIHRQFIMLMQQR